MRCYSKNHPAIFLFLVFWLLAACTPQPSLPPSTDNIEATVAAHVEETLVANGVSIEQKVQATLTVIAEATQVALASLPTETPTIMPTPTAQMLPTVQPSPTETATVALAPTATTLLPSPTPAGDAYGYQASGNANLRSGPGTVYAVAGGLKEGDRLRILARSDDNTWFYVETAEGIQAWLAAFLISPAPAVDALAVATANPLPPTAVPVAQAAVSAPAPAAQAAAPAGQRLNVSFINPHYNCDREAFDDFYRYFQADFFIENNSAETIAAKWEPTRWLISDGNQVRTDSEMGEWYSRRTGFYQQPDIPPGGSEGWTFVALRVELHEWVQAVEWEYKGQLYRQEFENNAINRAEWNYKGCS